MCLPTGVILGIYGPACVGKTYLAKWLTSKLNLPARHCGEEIKKAAAQSGLHTHSLPDITHVQIDESTLFFGYSHVDGCIIEGRYLNHVLTALTEQPLFLIQMTCPFEERTRRFGVRTGKTASPSEVTESDEGDVQFCRRRYNGFGLSPSLILSGTAPPVEQWGRIYHALGEIRP